MGIEGTLRYILELLETVRRKRKKKKQLMTKSLKVRMDCQGCERKVRHVLKRVKGARKVETNLKDQKVTVTGYNLEPKKLLAAVKSSTKKKVEVWPYVPYDTVLHPYVSQAYDKKAPRNMVRELAPGATFAETTVDHHYISIFSDDNPNSCSIM